MPDAFDADEARRALDEVPAPDLWGEASRRAAAVEVVSLTSDGGGDRRRPSHRWLAVAAVAAVAVLAVGTAAVVLGDDEDSAVDTAPATTAPPEPGTTVVGGACTVGISGDPIRMEPGPAEPPLFDLTGQADGQLVSHTMLGSQVAELHVPGLALNDLVGERVEEVELARGTAAVWFEPDFVQVRWFTGAQAPCESFTVTVAGGSEDANRHAAVDLAERILLPSDLRDRAGAGLERTAWALDHVTVGDTTTDANREAFSILDGEASWSDGCNLFSAPYTQTSPAELVLGEVTSTAVGCDPDPVGEAIAAVMSPGSVEVAFGSGVEALQLTRGDTRLTLTPAESLGETSTTVGGESSAAEPDPVKAASLVGSAWVLVGIRTDDGGVTLIRAIEPSFEFGPDTISFTDTCNDQMASGVAYEESTITPVSVGGTERGCSGPIMEQVGHIHAVMTGPMQVAFEGEQLELSGGGRTLVLRPA
jgi:heat shock protein HslJ